MSRRRSRTISRSPRRSGGSGKKKKKTGHSSKPWEAKSVGGKESGGDKEKQKHDSKSKKKKSSKSVSLTSPSQNNHLACILILRGTKYSHCLNQFNLFYVRFANKLVGKVK